ncbi:MAG: class II SORL domain-containing protein [Anaerolineae bacterium]|nr:class II SORL domain-containing protein [Anaerolineae bacterium]
MKLGDKIQSADWKAEKHVPVIEAPETVAAGELFNVTVSVGKEIAHPNTTEHHIRWIDVYFQPDGDKFVYQVAHFDFNAHGESAKGANQGPVYTHPLASFSMKVEGAGTLMAVSLCNIHGLWESSAELKIA